MNQIAGSWKYIHANTKNYSGWMKKRIATEVFLGYLEAITHSLTYVRRGFLWESQDQKRWDSLSTSPINWGISPNKSSKFGKVVFHNHFFPGVLNLEGAVLQNVTPGTGKFRSGRAAAPLLTWILRLKPPNLMMPTSRNIIFLTHSC